MDSTELEKLKGKNWIATMLFCWFLGGLGAHRFYTGKQNSAWAMLVMTLTGCLAPVTLIWTLIDGIMIALGKYTTEDGSELYERINWLGYVYIVLMILGIIGIAFYIAFIIFMIVAVGASSGSVPPVAP